MEVLRAIPGSIPQSLHVALAIIGGILVSCKILSFLRLTLNTLVLGGTNLSKYGPKGTWAVVTGASDGLGKEFAYQLAAKGFNLILVSRTESKLQGLKRDLEEKYFTECFRVKILAMDYSKDDPSDYKRLSELLTGLDVGILINNVGQSHSIPVSFLETAPEELHNIVTINCLGTLKTTQVVAPILAERKKGLILTIGSFAGWTPTPYLATYSGSKAFLQYWSSSLASELKPKGVDVQLAISYLVMTAMSKVRRASLLVPRPEKFVRSTLAKIGIKGTHQIANTYTPYWTHAFFLWIVEKTAGSTSRLTININRNMHINIRDRALRKAAREGKKK